MLPGLVEGRDDRSGGAKLNVGALDTSLQHSVTWLRWTHSTQFSTRLATLLARRGLATLTLRQRTFVTAR